MQCLITFLLSFRSRVGYSLFSIVLDQATRPGALCRRIKRFKHASQRL